MTKIKNTANTVDKPTEVNRAQIEHRAAWMALIYDEMKKASVDAEAIIRRAIRRCGRAHGEVLRKACGEAGNCETFAKVFPSELGEKTFDMRPVRADSENLRLDFHYCALVSAWQKLGLSDSDCALLCNMAMEGDRGIAEVVGLKLELTDTIAGGCETCKLRFHP